MPEIKTIPEQEINVYKFEELSDNAKREAMSNYIEHGLDFEADFMKDEFVEDLSAIGIYADKKELYWSAERGREWWFAIWKGGSVEDVRKFLKYCKVDLRSKRARDLLKGEEYLSIETQHFACARAENYITMGCEQQDDLTECLQNKYNEFLNRIEGKWEYMNSEEYFKDLCDINEHRFLENGEMA